MKKFALIALVIVLTLSLCACGRRGNDVTTVPTTEPTTAPTVLPTPGTNATLDPTTEPSMPEPSDGTLGTDGSNGEHGTAATNGRIMPVG